MTADALTDPGVAAARAGLEAAREPRAQAPRPDPEGLRNAYLELLKLTLCDLTGTTTGAVVALPDGTAAAKELAGDDLRLRAAGMDWPRYGLTMVGLSRLDDLQRCVESIVADDVPGDLVEAGAWRGGASILMRATLDSLGARERTVWVADSFQGFPREHAEQRDDAYLSSFEFMAAPLAEVQSAFARFGLEEGVEFVPGFFADTLPTLAGGHWSLIRLDGDTRDATLTTLECLYPGLATGGYVLVDDYGAVPECREAVDEFRTAHGITEPLEAVDWTGVRWRRTGEGHGPAAGAPEPATGRATTQAAVAPARARIPTHEEIELNDHLRLERARLAAARAEIDELRGAPLLAAARDIRRRMRGRR